MIDVGLLEFRSHKYSLLHIIRFYGIAMHGMVYSKVLGLQSGSQVAHNKSLLMVLYRHDQICMHGDLSLLSQTSGIC